MRIIKITLAALGIVFVTLAIYMIVQSSDPIGSRDQFFESGKAYLEDEQLEEAIIQFRNALRIDERYIPARLALADAFTKAGNHQGAFDVLREGNALNPENQEIKLHLANYYLLAGAQDPQWFREAQRLALELLEEDPDNLRARIVLGNSYAGLRDLPGSIAEMQQVLEQDPENLAAQLSLGASQLGANERSQAEATFLDAVEKHPDSAQAHRSLASFYGMVSQYGPAETHFRRAFELDPADNVNVLALVRFYMATDRPAEAAGVFEEAIEKNPENLSNRLNLANFYISRDQKERGMSLLHDLYEESREERPGLRLAEIYLREDRIQEAEAIVGEILKQNRRSGGARYLNGRLLLLEGKREEALAELEMAIEFEPRLVPPYLYKAQILTQRGRFSEAEEPLREALRINSNHLEARAALARVLALRREAQDALVQAEAVLRRAPDNVEALSARAEAYMVQRRIEESRNQFLSLHERQPENPYFIHRLGTLSALQQDREGALRYFRMALDLEPNLVEAVNDLVVVHLQAGDHDAALAEVDRVSESFRRQDLLHVLRGRLFIGKRDYDGAERELRSALRINPDNYQPYLLLGQINLAKGDVEQAIREVDELIAKDDRFAPAYLMKAFYQAASDDKDGAVENYRKVLDINPDVATAANNLAWIYCEREENLLEARTLAERARRLHPENAEFADTLGWVYYKMGNYRLAVDQLLFAVNEGRPTAAHYYRLGMAYYKQGEHGKAVDSIRQALSAQPDFPEADQARAVLREIGEL